MVAIWKNYRFVIPRYISTVECTIVCMGKFTVEYFYTKIKIFCLLGQTMKQINFKFKNLLLDLLS